MLRLNRPKVSPELDPSTLSNYENFTVELTTLHFDVKFDEKIVIGKVTYHLVNQGKADHVDLDTSYLDVNTVVINTKSVEYKLHERKQTLGSKLSIAIPLSIPNKFELTIEFATTSKCTALQFLDKEATDGKKYPYLFCQCQAIHARSLFPCFDTPGIKSPFEYTVKSPLNTLMSGLFVKQEKDTYFFKQPVPIPSYLVSIASGDIARASIGPRSDIMTEPVNLDKCKWEFEKDTEKFIQIAENLIFDYEWQRFDSLVLPASFPYGGMEIPNLCQLTPTLICGDRSLVNVVAHELAHSWSGNLVTNCSWEHFWLNEGWTMYIERRLLEAIAVIEAKNNGMNDKEAEAYGEQVRQFSAIIGWTDLENDLKSMGDNVDKYSVLVQNLKNGQDPDDSFSTVPYEKGFNLLYLIEKTVGKSKFDHFIRDYFKHFRYKSLDTYQFVDYLYNYFKDEKQSLDGIDWDEWLFKPGMPPVDPKFDTSLADVCYKLAKRWYLYASNKDNGDTVFVPGEITSFTANQHIVLLDTLISYEKVADFSWKQNPKAMFLMSQLYKNQYSSSPNAEIKFRWFYLQVTGGTQDFENKLGEFLGTTGRMKFVRPGYMLLNKQFSNVTERFSIERLKSEFASVHQTVSKLRSPQEFFDFRRISKPSNFGEIQQRVSYNLGYFSANYITIVMILSVYALVTNLLLLFVLAFVILGVYGINKLGGEDLVTPFGRVNTSQLYTGLLIVAVPLGFLASPISTLMWLIGSSILQAVASLSSKARLSLHYLASLDSVDSVVESKEDISMASNSPHFSNKVKKYVADSVGGSWCAQAGVPHYRAQRDSGDDVGGSWCAPLSRSAR
ncbi:LAP2 [Candida oxycetoniae]|uniref:Leukotriene A(4) hydrolase n=1 Tax=Candida oxycetoniae TaxID=497107 RepID=A0AAI9SUC4_9ASCO|nr:LAP2 [Candida oxycetoniae]KAI3402669.2 LAP2 [Candida oxycetoniae]